MVPADARSGRLRPFDNSSSRNDANSIWHLIPKGISIGSGIRMVSVALPYQPSGVNYNVYLSDSSSEVTNTPNAGRPQGRTDERSIALSSFDANVNWNNISLHYITLLVLRAVTDTFPPKGFRTSRGDIYHLPGSCGYN